MSTNTTIDPNNGAAVLGVCYLDAMNLVDRKNEQLDALKAELKLALQGLKLVNDASSLREARSFARCTMQSMPEAVMAML